MMIQDDYAFNDIYNVSWGEATDTLNTIAANGKEEEFMYILESLVGAFGTPTLTEVNDWIAQKSEYIYDMLGIE